MHTFSQGYRYTYVCMGPPYTIITFGYMRVIPSASTLFGLVANTIITNDMEMPISYQW